MQSTKGMKKHTGINYNAEYYMNDRKDQKAYILC